MSACDWIKAKQQNAKRSLQAVVLRIWWGMVSRECWKCAHRLITLGQENGAAQEHINAAKDALYRAAAAAEAEREDAQNVEVCDGGRKASESKQDANRHSQH